MGKFDKPQEIEDVEAVFGGRNVFDLMPKRKDLPEKFANMNSTHPAIKFQRKWFFEGLEERDIPPTKQGIDRDAALKHLAAIQSSFAPKHEEKQAAVAYLADKWFDFSNM